MAEVEMTKAAYEAALEQAKQEGLKTGETKGRTEGANAERERIQAVEKASLPGHEKLIASLKFDGKTTGAEAALQVVAAENALRGEELAKMRANAPTPVPESAGSAKADADGTITPEGKAAKEEMDPAALAVKAQDLVAAAKKDGKYLSYAQAVAQLTAK